MVHISIKLNTFYQATTSRTLLEVGRDLMLNATKRYLLFELCCKLRDQLQLLVLTTVTLKLIAFIFL
jgi:hypothetical protein